VKRLGTAVLVMYTETVMDASECEWSKQDVEGGRGRGRGRGTLPPLRGGSHTHKS
jgi:hypothetical protein